MSRCRVYSSACRHTVRYWYCNPGSEDRRQQDSRSRMSHLDMCLTAYTHYYHCKRFHYLRSDLNIRCSDCKFPPHDIDPTPYTSQGCYRYTFRSGMCLFAYTHCCHYKPCHPARLDSHTLPYSYCMSQPHGIDLRPYIRQGYFPCTFRSGMCPFAYTHSRHYT